MRNMVDTNMVEEIDGCNFFDQIDDLLEFPNDDVETGIFDSGVGDSSAFPPVWTNHSSGFSAGYSYSASNLSTELSVPYEDIIQLEWLSTFVEDSFSGGGLTLQVPSTSSDKEWFGNQYQTSSPVSVLESSSACLTGKTLPVSHEKRARSKRPRPATFTPRASIHLIAPASSSVNGTSDQPPLSNASSESENFGESYSSYKPVEQQQKKKQKIKIRPPVGVNANKNENPNTGPVRKCMHCEITKTPQWRTGPMGPKTLCNACGVRHKSGRLFPEYRPAASPTFVPSIHSNSHKKVLEMRTTKPVKGEHSQTTVFNAAAPASVQVELNPQSELISPYM